MLAKLALLSQAVGPQGVSIYTVELLDDDENVVKNLYKESLRDTLGLDVANWSDKRKGTQYSEWISLQLSARADGMQGWPLREEGGFEALPPENSPIRRQLLPADLHEDTESLIGLPALRVYCLRVQDSLILLYACVKTTQSWQECPYAALYGNKSRTLSNRIDQAVRDQDIVISNSHVDASASYSFPITF